MSDAADVPLRLLTSRDPVERGAGEDWVYTHGTEAVEPLCKLLIHPQARTRALAAELLGRLGDERALPALRGAFSRYEERTASSRALTDLLFSLLAAYSLVALIAVILAAQGTVPGVDPIRGIGAGCACLIYLSPFCLIRKSRLQAAPVIRAIAAITARHPASSGATFVRELAAIARNPVTQPLQTRRAAREAVALMAASSETVRGLPVPSGATIPSSASLPIPEGAIEARV
jgi:HEAT repeat protein